MQGLQIRTVTRAPSLVATRGEYEQAGVVHDLGNLIQVVSSALNILSRELVDSSRLTPVLATARSSLERASALIRQNMKGACASAANESVDLERLLVDLLPTLQSIAGSAITVALSASGKLPRLDTNPVELENAVLNLALNSRDAMPAGGALDITLGLTGGEMFLRVADGGKGMAPEVAARALEPFFTTKGESGGSGVGLAMVARFAANAGGRIALESAVGVGTTITLLFPAQGNGMPS